MIQNHYLQRFSESIVSEIKAEMGRRGLSSRGLGRLINKSSQYMSDRLDGGSSKTGKRVPLNVRDLVAIADALDISASELVDRALIAAPRSDEPIDMPDRFERSHDEGNVAERRRVASNKQGVVVGRFGTVDVDQDDDREVASESLRGLDEADTDEGYDNA